MPQYFHFCYFLGGSDAYPEFHYEKTINDPSLSPVLKYVSSYSDHFRDGVDDRATGAISVGAGVRS